MSEMSDFAIEPELHVRAGRFETRGQWCSPGLVLRSLDQAAEFARGMARERNNRLWDGVLYRLEAARTQEEANDAANALRALLEAEDLLVIQPRPAACPADHPDPRALLASRNTEWA